MTFYDLLRSICMAVFLVKAALVFSTPAYVLTVDPQRPTLLDSLTFHTAQEALHYASQKAADDTVWTEVRFMPAVYWMDDPDDEAVRRPLPGDHEPYGMKLTLHHTRLIGLGREASETVLAVNRGQTQGAEGNFTMWHLTGDYIAAENLTFGNYCNVDLVYPRDPKENRLRRAEAIVQAQLILAKGRHYEATRCRFLSRLNLCPFAGADDVTFRNCYFECTDDALCGTGRYLHCAFTFYSAKPFYATADSGAYFFDCDLHTLVHGTQYLTKVSSPVRLEQCRWTSEDPDLEIAWTPRPNPRHRCEMTGCTLNGKPLRLDPTPDIPMPVEPLALPLAAERRVLAAAWTLDCYKPADCAAYDWQADTLATPWVFGEGVDGAAGCFGLIPVRRGARLQYAGRSGETYKGQTLTLTIDPCKAAGQGFGSATGQYLDVCIQYDPLTLTGYGLRIYRTPEADRAVYARLITYQHGGLTFLTEGERYEGFKRGFSLKLTAQQGCLTASLTNPTLSTLPPLILTASLSQPLPWGGILVQHTGTVGSNALVIRSLQSAYTE